MKKLINILGCLLVTLTLFAQNSDFGPVKYHPDMNLHIGSAFDATYTLTEKQQCIAYDEVVWLDGKGAVETTLEMKLVNDYRKLYEEMNLDMNFEAGFKMEKIVNLKANVNFKSNHEKKYKVEDRMITILLKAKSDYGRLGMKNRKLKPEFQELIEQGKHEEFIQKCGKYFVSQERRGAEVNVLINIRDLSKSAKKKLELEYSTNFEGTFYKVIDVSGKEKHKFSQLMEQASELGKIDIQYYAVGTEGISALENLVRNFDPKDINKILNAMGDALATSNRENSAPLQYNIASMSQFGLQMPSFDPLRYDYMSKIYTGLLTLNNNIDQINEIQHTRKTTFENYYAAKLLKLKSQREILINAAKNCIHSGICDESVFRYFENIIWPWDMTDRNRLQIIPTYREVVDETGKPVGQLLTDISIRVKGVLYHAPYYSKMTFAYFSADQRLYSLQNLKGISGNRVSINPRSRTRNKVEFNDYVALVDYQTIGFNQFHSNGYVLNNAENRRLAEELLNTYKNRNYLLHIYTKDGLETTYDLGLGNFRNLPVFRPLNALQN